MLTTVDQGRSDIASMRGRFDRALADFLSRQIAEFADVHLFAALDLIRRFVLADGKRLRPLFCYWGWRCAATPGDEDAAVRAAASLELFHSFALIHDDIMDASDLRRGEPTLHHSLAGLAPAERAGDRDRLGVSLAILAGDLCAMWSTQMFHESGADAVGIIAAQPWLSLMRNEVVLGQYLDLTTMRGSIPAAEQVIKFKTARYTITRPLQIGAALAGATESVLRGFERFGDPLGAAFQLRDDLLGVFGEPARTGKPTMDDLRGGRPTVLIELARTRADARRAEIVDRLYGNADLDENGATTLREAIAATGAIQVVESMIEQRRQEALDVLADLPVAADARHELHALASAVTARHR